MRLPVVTGVIERRILVNYRVDPDLLARQLPAPFEPKRQAGYGIAGICLIRLGGVRPRGLPAVFGIGSENAAHRIAVRWREDDGWREGVYIPRRDTDSALNTLLGGRLFPGEHERARFEVHEARDEYHVALRSHDGRTSMRVEGRVAATFPDGSCFPTLEAASEFFEAGSLGYSATRRAGRFDALELRSHNWKVEPLAVSRVESSYFDRSDRFPPDSVLFDCALLMRDIRHEWVARAPLNSRNDRTSAGAIFSS